MNLGRGGRLTCFVLVCTCWSLQVQAQGESPGRKVGFGGTAWFGNSTSTTPDASTDAGLGLAGRVDLRVGPGRVGLEFGVLHLSGSISFPPIFDEFPDYAPTAPLKSEHLLATYEVRLGRKLYVRPGIGFARHRLSSLNTNTGATSMSGEWGGALSLAAGYRVAQLGEFDVAAEGLWRHSRGEDSTSPRNFLGVGLTLALR